LKKKFYNWFKRETKEVVYQTKRETKSRLVRGENKLEIKGKETKDLKEKTISSFQSIPSSFNDGVQLIDHTLFLLCLLNFGIRGSLYILFLATC